MNTTRPPSSGPCIKNCGRRAGATPWLCLYCLAGIARQLAAFEFKMSPHNIPGSFISDDLGAKRLINKIQKKSRKAYKKHPR